MKILTLPDVQKLIQILGITKFYQHLLFALTEDFGRWHQFHKSTRHATHYNHGVIELMPCSDDQFYGYKYVNGHPENPSQGMLSVVAIGQLSAVASGYPLMISEMTLLTALRTAATGALAARYLARSDATKLAVIGNGAQAEFQVLALSSILPIQQVYYFDIDEKAMTKFHNNLAGLGMELFPGTSIKNTIPDADIILTLTAAKKRQTLFTMDELSPGVYIQAMGGDCPGKTELGPDILERAKVVVEYKPQSLEEGEVQQCHEDAIYAELWELVTEQKPGRINDTEITLFDAVGFALEDWSILRVVYQLAEQYHLGTEMALIPELVDPKNLYGLLSEKTH